ncbi:hypothetical protein, partial [Nitrosospira multiformis]|uniref:hypothetical protein n=1 Tax=Nitrosospira multiformis TaxID=1231 RepID=UPI001C626A57
MKDHILSFGLSSPRPWGRREWGDSPCPHGQGLGMGGVKARQIAGYGFPCILLSPQQYSYSV